MEEKKVIVWVDEATRKKLKVGAAKAEITIGEFVKNLL